MVEEPLVRRRPFTVSVAGEPVFEIDGRFVGYRGTSRDVTRRKRADSLVALEHAVTRSLA